MGFQPASVDPSDPPQVAELKRQLHWDQLRIQLLEERLRLHRIQKYGPASEKLSDAPLELLELEPGVSAAEVQAESEREPLPAGPPKQSRSHPGRQELPADLPRVERVLACAPEQCTGRLCGQPMALIGYDVSEQLDVEPAEYFVRVTKHEKRACKGCEEGGVAAAPAPARIIDKGLVSDRVVIDTVAAKYSDHLPLYRALKPKMEAAGATSLPSSALGKAVQYTLALWLRLTRFLDYPELELSTNLAENSMRPVALGRKNWIHLGGPQAGPKVAAILSVLETCRRLMIPVREYLGAILPGLAGTSIQRLAELTPAAWAARNR